MSTLHLPTTRNVLLYEFFANEEQPFELTSKCFNGCPGCAKTTVRINGFLCDSTHCGTSLLGRNFIEIQCDGHHTGVVPEMFVGDGTKAQCVAFETLCKP